MKIVAWRLRLRNYFIALSGVVSLLMGACAPEQHRWRTMEDARVHLGHHWVSAAVPDQTVLSNCIKKGEAAEKIAENDYEPSRAVHYRKDKDGHETYVKEKESAIERGDRVHRAAAFSFLSCMKEEGGYSLLKDGPEVY